MKTAPQPPPPPTVRVRVWVRVMVTFRVGGQPDNCPRRKLPPVDVRVSVRVSFGVGRNFPRGQLA